MSRSSAITLRVLVVIGAFLSGEWLRGESNSEKALEMYRHERERAVSVTVQDVEKFVTRDRWGPDDGWDARVVVQAAGNSGKKEFRPVLKRAALAWSVAGYKSLTFCALHNLWKLGEPPEYFLHNVRAVKQNPELAMYSALVWGRDASAETLPQLDSIKELTPLDSPIRGYAYPAVQGAVGVYRQYAALKELVPKIDLVLRYASAGWSPLGAGDPISSHDPEPYWARRELHALCKQDPELVARRVLARDLLSEFHGSVQYDSLWEYLAQFLDDDALAAYRRLKPTRDEAARHVGK